MKPKTSSHFSCVRCCNLCNSLISILTLLVHICKECKGASKHHNSNNTSNCKIKDCFWGRCVQSWSSKSSYGADEKGRFLIAIMS